MQLTIHRGTHEIGGTCIELVSGRSRLILDLGLPLVNESGDHFSLNPDDNSVEKLIQSGVLPNIPDLFQKNIAVDTFLIISHAHQDHYGLAHYIDSAIPVYMTMGTKALMKASQIFLPQVKVNPDLHNLPVWKTITVGEFKVTTYLVDHSAPDSVALLIEADGKKVFYSGDFRASGRKKKVFDNLIKNPPEGIDCLLLEGTMMGRGSQQYKTEVEVEQAFNRIFGAKSNLALIFASGQNLDRLVSIYRAAKRNRQLFVIDLYTAFVLHNLRSISDFIPQFDWEGIRVKFWKAHADKLADSGNVEFLYAANNSKITIEEIVENAAKTVMIARSNKLFEIVLNRLSTIDGVEMIWSLWKGYLIDDNVVKQYCKHHNLELKCIHTSGHAEIKDLKKFVSSLNPKMLIPIHTFYPETYFEHFTDVVQLNDRDKIEI
jgi:ribonuclease J